MNTETITQDEIDQHLDKVLRASGSALRNYTMAKTLDDMRMAMRSAMQSGAASTPPAQAASHDACEDKSDALCDIYYVRGLQTGFSLRQADDNDGLAKAIESRSGAVSLLKDAQAKIGAAQAARVPDGLDTPWPLRDCVQKLADAADILLHQKNYDGHGHEEIAVARDSARKLLAAPAPAEIKSELAQTLETLEDLHFSHPEEAAAPVNGEGE